MPALTPAFLSRILGLRIRAKAVLEGALAGVHRSPFHGYSSEFSQYKGYVPGDDIRRLDWKAYARRDQLVTRQYRDETNTAVHLLLDTSASMGHRDAPDAFSKLDAARVLAAAVALLAERQRDSVSLGYGAAGIEAYLPPAGGPRTTGEILRRLEGLSAEGRTDLDALFTEEAARVAARGFVFLFTDLWQDPAAAEAGLRRVARKSRAATVVQIRARDEEEFFSGGDYVLRDAETGERLEVSAAQARGAYFSALREHAAGMAAACSRLNLRLVTVRTDEPMDAALRRVLP